MSKDDWKLGLPRLGVRGVGCREVHPIVDLHGQGFVEVPPNFVVQGGSPMGVLPTAGRNPTFRALSASAHAPTYIFVNAME